MFSTLPAVRETGLCCRGNIRKNKKFMQELTNVCVAEIKTAPKQEVIHYKAPEMRRRGGWVQAAEEGRPGVNGREMTSVGGLGRFSGGITGLQRGMASRKVGPE